MKFTVLGTAAAEAVPNPYCQCKVCEIARSEGGREIRARSAALVNDDLLIDLGPDIISSVNQWRIFLGDLETLLVTHAHEDHWLPQNLIWRRAVFTPTLGKHLTIYAPADVLSGLHPMMAEQAALSWRAINGGEQWIAGRYSITAIPATHGDGHLQAVLYVIDDGIHRVFYATDTAPLSEKAWEILRTLKPMDLILLDATMGPADGGLAHHGITQFLNTRQALINEGLLVPSKTILAAHHFSHNSGLTHKDLIHVFSPYGVEVSYDGWVINM